MLHGNSIFVIGSSYVLGPIVTVRASTISLDFYFLLSFYMDDRSPDFECTRNVRSYCPFMGAIMEFLVGPLLVADRWDNYGGKLY
jgi:hypothetical protein